MFPSRAWLRQLGHSLAERLDRLGAMFETLRERLRAAISEAIGQTVAGAVHDAIHAVLADTNRPEEPSRLYRAPDTPRPWWRDPEERPWADDREHWHEGDHEEPSQELHQAPPQPAPARLRKALVVVFHSAAWLLRRWTGRCPLEAALTMAAAGIGLVGSIVSLTCLGDAVGTGATAIRPFRCP